jgi:hypothetical protein
MPRAFVLTRRLMLVINIPPCNLFEFFRSRGQRYGNFYRESAYAEIRFASRNSIKTRVCSRISRVRASTGASLHLGNSTKQTDSERWYREQVLEDHPPSDDRYINRERERGGEGFSILLPAVYHLKCAECSQRTWRAGMLS